MFFIAVTKNEISHLLKNYAVEEIKKNSFIFSIYIDNFLSKLLYQPSGFKIIESPLVSSDKYNNILFSQIQYDEKNDILTIFKSTLSGRPIYYSIDPSGNFFCSSHIHLLRLSGVPIQENFDVLPEFFVYRYVMPPQTLYKDIYQIITGSKVCIKLKNGKWNKVCEETYNPISSIEKQHESLDKIADNTINFLDESIKDLNPCKDHLAVLFSGGLDSSILFRICQKNYKINSSYSTGYPFENQKENIERKYAQTAAEAFNINHNYFASSTRDYLNSFIESISKAEEPLHHLQSVMMYLLFKNGLPKDKNLAISGEGADGCFGTNLHYSIFVSNKLAVLSKVPVFSQISKYTSFGSVKLQSFVSINKRKSFPISNVNNIVWALGAYGDIDWSSRYYNVDKNAIIRTRYAIIKKFEDRSIYDLLSLLSLIGEGSITQSIWSKLGESQSKILYYPFTNIKLLNYISSLPWSLKVQKPKNILRCVAHQLDIPQFIINRRKSSFGIQNDIWACKGGIFEPLIPLAKKVFEEKNIRQMQSPDSDRAMVFWNMLNYAIWKRLCIDNESLDVLLEELNETM